MNKSRQVLAWLSVVLWMALTSYLATDSFSGSWSQGLLRFWVTFWHLPLGSEDLELANLILRKTAHVLEFFVLGLLLYRALSQDRYSTVWETFGRVLLAGGAYAVFNEVHQAFTVSRGPSLRDSGWDFGGVLGSQLWIWLRNQGTRRRRLALIPKP